MPVLMPGPTTSAGAPMCALKKRWSPNTAGGTTDEMIPASIERHGNPSMSSSVFSSTAYSSEVRAATVWIRQLAASVPSRNTPSTVFVFPTSTAHSTVIWCADGSSPGTGVVGSDPPMGALSKIFAMGLAAMIAVAAAGCGSSDSPPKPLQRKFDEIHVARFTLEQKAEIVRTRNDWEVARMENANAEAQLGEISNQVGIVRNEQKAAKLAVDSAVSNKKAADASADTNRINAAQQQLHTAELLLRAADARVKYFDAYREYVKRLVRHTAESMYWREAQFEVAKAQLAQQNNIAPKGVSYEWYPKQEAERSKRAQAARSKVESEKQRAQGARETWLKLQQSADQASGQPTSYPDPMAPPMTTGSAIP